MGALDAAGFGAAPDDAALDAPELAASSPDVAEPEAAAPNQGNPPPPPPDAVPGDGEAEPVDVWLWAQEAKEKHSARIRTAAEIFFICLSSYLNI